MLDLNLAFSHAQPSLVFVQHLMLQQRDRLWRLIAEGAHIYICGHLRMGQGVDDAIKVCAKVRNLFVSDLI